MKTHFPIARSAGILLAALTLAGGVGRAGPTFTVDAAVREARANNPDLAAARHLITEAGARARSTGRLANPEIETEIAAGPEAEGRLSVGFTQRLPVTARLRHERTLSALAIEAARLELRDREQILDAAVREAFYTLAAARDVAALATRQTAAARDFARSLDAAAADGLATKLEAGQAALEADALQAAETPARVAEVEALARLNTLLGAPAATPRTPAGPLTVPAAPPRATPPGVRADIQLAEGQERTGGAEVALARSARWEDAGVGVFVEGERFRDEPDGIEPEALVGLRFSLPVPLWQDGSGRVAEKQAAQARARDRLTAVRRAAANEVRTAHAILLLRHRAARLAEDTLLPAARRQAAETEAARSRGEADLTAVFRAQERLFQHEAAASTARWDYFRAYAAWQRALGDPSLRP
jgi:outer membrane protein TolC